jgi:hypothetical protein
MFKIDRYQPDSSQSIVPRKQEPTKKPTTSTNKSYLNIFRAVMPKALNVLVVIATINKIQDIT